MRGAFQLLTFVHALPSWHDGILVFAHADVPCDVGVVVTWHSRGRVIGLADGEEERGVVTSS